MFVRLGTARVRELCAPLSVDARLLLLRLVAGLTVEQVAGTVGKSVGATKALRRRGLAALQRRARTTGRNPVSGASDYEHEMFRRFDLDDGTTEAIVSGRIQAGRTSRCWLRSSRTPAP